MKIEDFVGPVLIVVFIVGCLLFGNWLTRPRTVVVDGVHCVQSGFGNSAAISCDWSKQENVR